MEKTQSEFELKKKVTIMTIDSTNTNMTRQP